MAIPQPFHASQLRSLASLVESEIERQILVGEIEAGERVNELALSRRLGVSRGPIREALQSLRRAGLIEIVANRGAIVRNPVAGEALDLFDLRSALLAVMSQRVAERRGPADLKALESNIAASETALKHKRAADYYRLNLDFHELIVSASCMLRAAETYRDAVKELHLIRRRGLLTSEPAMRKSLAEHRAILSAIRRRDGAKAFHAARAHVLSGKSRFATTVNAPTADAPKSALGASSD
jgi:DNA-binding GntR family transcriptional regulator